MLVDSRISWGFLKFVVRVEFFSRLDLERFDWTRLVPFFVAVAEPCDCVLSKHQRLVHRLWSADPVK